MADQSSNPLAHTIRLVSAQEDSFNAIVDDYIEGAADQSQLVHRLSVLHAHHTQLSPEGQTQLAEHLQDTLIDDPTLHAILDDMVVMSGVRPK